MGTMMLYFLCNDMAQKHVGWSGPINPQTPHQPTLFLSLYSCVCCIYNILSSAHRDWLHTMQPWHPTLYVCLCASALCRSASALYIHSVVEVCTECIIAFWHHGWVYCHGVIAFWHRMKCGASAFWHQVCQPCGLTCSFDSRVVSNRSAKTCWFEPAIAGAINSIWRTCATATQKKGCAALLRHTRCARRASTRCCDSHAQGYSSAKLITAIG